MLRSTLSAYPEGLSKDTHKELKEDVKTIIAADVKATCPFGGGAVRPLLKIQNQFSRGIVRPPSKLSRWIMVGNAQPLQICQHPLGEEYSRQQLPGPRRLGRNHEHEAPVCNCPGAKGHSELRSTCGLGAKQGLLPLRWARAHATGLSLGCTHKQ